MAYRFRIGQLNGMDGSSGLSKSTYCTLILAIRSGDGTRALVASRRGYRIGICCIARECRSASSLGSFAQVLLLSSIVDHNVWFNDRGEYQETRARVSSHIMQYMRSKFLSPPNLSFIFLSLSFLSYLFSLRVF